MLIQPRPKPVITMTSAPIICCGEPAGGASRTAARSMCGIVRIMKRIVMAPVAQVRTDWMRMIV